MKIKKNLFKSKVFIINLFIFITFICFTEFLLSFFKANEKSSKFWETNRIIRLREPNPNSFTEVFPSNNYLKITDSLEKRFYKVEVDQDGYILPTGNINAKNRILFLGGSTTECLYVSEEKRFPRQVQI